MINNIEIKRPILKVGTHDGIFHADDVLAVALLKVVYHNYEVVVLRTRDEVLLSTCDILVDVGKKYDGEKYFDHHQDSELECSASLLWKAVAEVNYPYHYYYVNRFVLDAVSGVDVNFRQYEKNNGPSFPYYDISSLISDMNYLDSNSFESAVQIGILFWKAIINKCDALKTESEILLDGKRDGKVLWISEGMNINNHEELLDVMGVVYVVHPHYNPSKYCLKSVNNLAYPLPEFNNAEYIHHTKFLAIFSNLKDVESAVQSL